MRLRRSRGGLPAGWQVIAQQRLRQWPLLDDADRLRLAHGATRLLAKRWEASHGFAIDGAMRVTVAVHAALLTIGSPEEPFRNVSAIVIHPTTMVLRGERPAGIPGVVTNAPLHALGHTSANGPVHIAWDTVERELATPDRRSNVILHEFAHKVDALNGMLDGTPPLADRAQRQTWVEVCTAEMHALRRGTSAGILSAYAATNPSEFFAVATEAFFEQPQALRLRTPRLYAVLARFYRQDLAARADADGAAPAAPRTSVTWTVTPP